MLTPIQALRADAVAQNIPVISPNNAIFLTEQLRLRKPMRVLEIGSAIGLSSAVIAQSLSGWGAHLTTVEISVPTQAIAQSNLSAMGIHNVLSLCGDARVLLRQWADRGKPLFDCIFIDAQKSQTHVFYTKALSMLADNGLLIVDDVWKYRHKMSAFYALLADSHQAYRLHFIDEHDATMLVSPR